MRLLLHFARCGPYHHARLRSAADALGPLGWEVIGLETAGTDATYAWDETSGGVSSPRIVTAFPGRVHEEITVAEYRQILYPLLDSLAPDAVSIAGWGTIDSQLILAWCRKHDVRRIVMSETREADGKRVWWKELLKRYLVSRFDGALVGGRSHRDYLVKLGMPAEKICFGYNVVDNGYFAEKTQDYKTQDAREEGRRQRTEVRGHELEVRGQESEVGVSEQAPNSSFQLSAFQFSAFPPKCFLASNRFIERKNLARLIEAYAAYARRGQESGGRDQETVSEDQQSTINNQQSSIWPLCLLGDGELKTDLIAQCHALGLNVIESAPWETSLSPDSCLLSTDSMASHLPLAPVGTSGSAWQSGPTVFFPGFRQIEELPRFYAYAGCFVHPALEEPWGLVLNEAMACGLPILSGDNVGAAEELVDDGVNGWKFDAGNVEEMAKCLMNMAELSDEKRQAFGAASVRILEERCPTEAFGRGLAEILKGLGRIDSPAPHGGFGPAGHVASSCPNHLQAFGSFARPTHLFPTGRIANEKPKNWSRE